MRTSGVRSTTPWILSRAARTSSIVGAAIVRMAFFLSLELQPRAPPGGDRRAVDVLGGGQVLDRDPQRLEDRDVLGRDPPRDPQEEKVPQVAQEVVLPERPLLQGDEEVARLLHHRLLEVAEEAGAGDRRGVELARGRGAGADRVDVGARGEPVAE